HLRVVEIELTLADLESVESRIDRRRKALRADPRDHGLVAEVDALESALQLLSDGTPLYRADLSQDRRAALQEHFLLTNKPVMAVLNIGEDQLAGASELASELGAALPGCEVLPLSVQLEAEAAMLPEEERAELLEGLGLGEGALPVFVRAAHDLLGLRTFLTTGEKESRAWTFKHGWKAPQCAGRIHTDFERGFIRAEVIAHNDLLALGSWVAAREAGQLRLEGKDYEMKDGDVVEFRFNV
ncbi:MAG: DUF933 domain-containing protein, partial [Actinomycetota bacterium]|nr:DUF933 domain-containing protein [Actinomycetota bacterium]